VGFLGAGAILRQGGDIRGLTTAAEIWVAASLGMAVGFGYYAIAIFTTIIVLVVLVVMRPIERHLFKHKERRHTDPPPPADV
jgi:putative Mg2+ transporter-C (MgtC) family protein